MIFFIFVHLRMSIFSTSSLHIGKMEFIFKVLRRNYCDMAQNPFQYMKGEMIHVHINERALLWINSHALSSSFAHPRRHASSYYYHFSKPSKVIIELALWLCAFVLVCIQFAKRVYDHKPSPSMRFST